MVVVVVLGARLLPPVEFRFDSFDDFLFRLRDLAPHLPEDFLLEVLQLDRARQRKAVAVDLLQSWGKGIKTLPKKPNERKDFTLSIVSSLALPNRFRDGFGDSDPLRLVLLPLLALLWLLLLPPSLCGRVLDFSHARWRPFNADCPSSSGCLGGSFSISYCFD